jgi:hypothetical protein
MDHIGLFFFFTGCAAVSIVVWIFNWVCWMNQCCCCDFLHNPVNKRIAWWMSFTFLLGVLACCISAFVSVNRFGFAIDGAWCAVDRIYYDIRYGQLKTTQPKWEGFTGTNSLIDNFNKFIQNLPTTGNCGGMTNPNKDFKIQKIIDSCVGLKEKTISTIVFEGEGFDKIKTGDKGLLKEYHYYLKRLKACLKVLSMIYYCLFLIATTLAAVSLMFYACLKRQGYLLTVMHVLWNVIRFFIFSFFLYGTAYGIFFLILRDMVYVTNYIFDKENLDKQSPDYVDGGQNTLKFCLYENKNYIYKDENIKDVDILSLLNDFFKYYYINYKTEGKTEDNEIRDKFCDPDGKDNKLKCSDFDDLCERAGQIGGLFGSFDCGFVKDDLNNLKWTLSDASTESRILAATSLSASFFGAVAIYFFLLVMHHYNNELFFDTGKSIFTGFDGFGGGYKKKNVNKDPAYKKRKLRAEIELTSKNDEASNYKDVNKNDDDE